MNSFNSFCNSIRNAGIYIINTIFIYDFPAIDPSLVLYYPLDNSSGIQTANFASKLPVYDASMSGSMITYSPNNFVTSYGDLSLNNTMGGTATSYVVSNKSFVPNISGGFSISLWFSCSGELGKTGTLISMYRDSTYSSFEIDISGSTLFSGYYIPQPVTFSVTGGGSKSEINSPNGNVNYIFTSNGTFTVNGTSGCTIKVLLVGAGGAGGNGGLAIGTYYYAGGGGGAGEVIETNNIIISSTTTFSVTIGTSGGGNTYFGTYQARAGGNGASYDNNCTNGGGGLSIFRANSNNYGAIGYKNYVGGNGILPYLNHDDHSGGGGAGSSGSGNNGLGLTIIQASAANGWTRQKFAHFHDNGGNGTNPSNYFIQNTYGIGGPTRTLFNEGAVIEPTTATLWRTSYASINIRNQYTPPNNTGHGGLGGTVIRTSSNNVYKAGGAGGSGICIVSIISS
jgi:hypothetical protein